MKISASLFTLICFLVGSLFSGAQDVSASFTPGFYNYDEDGDTRSFYVQVDYLTIALSELSFEVELPEGFAYAGSTNYTGVEIIPETTPTLGDTGTLSFNYTSIPTQTAQFRM
jgi:hypothetical protein